MPEEKRPEWLADQQSKEDWMATRRDIRPVEVAVSEPAAENMPGWLADVQPRKKEWSPVQDRIDAHFAGLRELSERRKRRREAVVRPFRSLVDWTAALVEARNELRAQAAEAQAAATAPTLAPPPPAAGPAPPPPAPARPATAPPVTPPAWAEPPLRPSPRPVEPPAPTHKTPRMLPALPAKAAPPPPPPPPAPAPVHKTPKVVRAIPKPPPPQPSAPLPPPVRVAPAPTQPAPVEEPPPAATGPEPQPDAQAVEPVEMAVPQPGPRVERPKKEKKPRANPLGAIVVQARLIQERREQARQAERAQIIYAIRRMNDEAYETMLLDFFRRDGYTVYRVDDPASSEADLELHRSGERTLVSIKRRGHQVGQESVRELDKEIATSGANSAFLFTDGSFTEAAVRVANNSTVTLVDGAMLAELIEELTMSELRERKASSRLAKAIGWGKKAS